MAYKKRTEIRIETDEILILQRRKRFTRVRCPQCNNLVSMLTIEEAAAVSRSSEREICRLIDEGQIHFTETGQGRLLICSVSLAGTENNGQVMLAE